MNRADFKEVTNTRSVVLMQISNLYQIILFLLKEQKALRKLGSPRLLTLPHPSETCLVDNDLKYIKLDFKGGGNVSKLAVF